MQAVNLCRLMVISILIVLISACATRPVPKYSVNAVNHQKQLQQISNWRIRGKLAFRSEQDKFSASLNWHQQDKDFRLNLSSFLGTNILLLEKQQGRVELQYDDNLYQHISATALLYDLLGWTLPVESISQWVKGQTSPEALAEFSDNGLLHRIQTSDGWVVNYSDYRRTGEVLLPHQINLQAGANNIKIRVDAWQLN